MTPKVKKRKRKILTWLGAAFVIVCVVLPIVLNALFPLPMKQRSIARVVLAEDGTPMWRFADENGVWRFHIKKDEVSPLYIDALLTYEDRWFYHHPGINPAAMLRALTQNITNGRIISGGSTITMQVARLIDPHPRTIPGKLRQVWRTLQLEWYFTKDEILELYINDAPFGGTLEGVAAASWAYLGKSPSQFTHAEAALMAVLPQAPSRLRPDRHPKRAEIARNKVLSSLERHNVWPEEHIREAMEENIWLNPRVEPKMAPLLARRLANSRPNAVIRTNIDIALQQRLEELLLGWESQMPERTSAGIIVVEHENMAVRAYLGSVDIHNPKRFGHVDMITAIRSPGSTLKPFIYGLALDDALIHSESLLQDVPRRYSDYRPTNFSSDFRGPVAASDALVDSLNLPAVQLMEAYGPKRFVAEMRHAGMPLFFRGEPTVAIILGGIGTRLEHLVSAYSVFARNGMLAQIRLLPEDPLVERRLLSQGAAWIIRRILIGQTRPDRADPLKQLNAHSAIGWKTGTSYGFRDAWAIGISHQYLIGIWIGRPDSTPVARQTGSLSATPLLLRVHDVLINTSQQRSAPRVDDPPPAQITTAQICWPGGQALPPSDPNCRTLRTAWILNDVVPPTLLPKNQPLGLGLWQRIWVNDKGLRVNPSCENAKETTIVLWPAPLEPWLPKNEWRESRLPNPDTQCPPMGIDRVTPIAIAGIKNNDTIMLPHEQGKTLNLNVSVIGGTGERWWFLNARPIGMTTGTNPLHIAIHIHGEYMLSVLDESGAVAKTAFSVVP